MMRKLIALTALVWIGALGWVWPAGGPADPVASVAAHSDDGLNAQLAAVLAAKSLYRDSPVRRSRIASDADINPKLADLGRLLWFDNAHSLHQDNTCAGCHSPTNGFGDTQSIAIGVDNNGIVGPRRTGARNQRRSPLVVNTAFLRGADVERPVQRAVAAIRSTTRRASCSRRPKGPRRSRRTIRSSSTCCRRRRTFRRPSSSKWRGSQGRAGPSGRASISSTTARVCGSRCPTSPGSATSRSGRRCCGFSMTVPEYRKLFGEIFPSVRRGDPIDFTMFGLAIAEFEFTLTFADAPIDQFARGHRNAMSTSEKRGALLFFGKAGCVKCHAVAGDANEMFSDFQNRVIGVPQIAPFFGVDESNMIFDGPGEDEDFGLEQITGEPGRSLQVPHRAAAEHRAGARVLPQRRVHAAGRRHPASSRRVRFRARLRSEAGRRGSGSEDAARTDRAGAGEARSAGSHADEPVEAGVRRSGRVRRGRVAGQTGEERESVQAGARLGAERPACAEVPGLSIASRIRNAPPPALAGGRCASGFPPLSFFRILRVSPGGPDPACCRQ